MKKSKVIIPALGVLVLSTAASITGTVAWFTASRTAYVTTGDFAVVATDGNIAASLTAGVGTTVAGTVVSPKQVSSQDIKLGDASFNPSTKQLWNNSGNSSSSFVTVGSTTSYTLADGGAHNWAYSSGKVYHAVSWKVTLTYTWGEDYTDLNIFLNMDSTDTDNNCTMTGSKDSGDTVANKTYEGYRIALITTSKSVVYAGLKPTANKTDVQSVTSSSAVAQTSTLCSVFCQGDTLTKAEDHDDETSRTDFLGKIQHTGDSDTLDIYCVAWYEGTDPKVVTGNEMDKVSARLGFYAALD